MEPQTNIEVEVGLTSIENRFIEANTLAIPFPELSNNHIIPVFTKFNEPMISHADFIKATCEVVKDIYHRDLITDPVIRVSHPIKGRVPEAKHKSAQDLLESEKTLYYERMAFMVELPLIFDTVEENALQLTVGGIKAYNLDNLNSNRRDQRFKAFIGFKNTICTNLCISTDGFKADITVRTLQDLKLQLRSLIENYNAAEHMDSIKTFGEYQLKERQVSHLIGRLKMYQHLPDQEKKHIPDLKLTDSQLSAFSEAYYNDPSFGRASDGSINLWRLYNNLTGSFKSSYIDTYLEKVTGSHHFVQGLICSLTGSSESHNWYLNN